METINSVIMVVSIIICLILTAYFIRWSAWKRIKPGYVQRNVLTFSVAPDAMSGERHTISDFSAHAA